MLRSAAVGGGDGSSGAMAAVDEALGMLQQAADLSADHYGADHPGTAAGLLHERCWLTADGGVRRYPTLKEMAAVACTVGPRDLLQASVSKAEDRAAYDRHTIATRNLSHCHTGVGHQRHCFCAECHLSLLVGISCCLERAASIGQAETCQLCFCTSAAAAAQPS
jgi:hypothetical protein